MHRNTKLTPANRKEIWRLWRGGEKPSSLAEKFRVTRRIIYIVLGRARLGDFSVHASANLRFRCSLYGIRKLERAELRAERELARRAHRYQKDYPGEMIHVDSKSLRRLPHENWMKCKSEVLLVAIDDRSRYLFADILPRKNMENAAIFLEQLLKISPYEIECIYSDNGSEFKGGRHHDFMWTCRHNGIVQRFTRPNRPQTNGKAERVIRTIMEECLNRRFKSREERREALKNYVVYYNTFRSHHALKEGKILLTPCRILEKFV